MSIADRDVRRRVIGPRAGREPQVRPVVPRSPALKQYAELAALVAPYLEPGRPAACRLVSIRRKMRKLILEFESVSDPVGESGKPISKRYVGKLYPTDRGRCHFDALKRLHDAGFRPPCPFTVASPIAYLGGPFLLLQEQAAGRPFADVIFGHPAANPDSIGRAAEWLAKLHTSGLTAEPKLDGIRAALVRHGRELAEARPGDRRAITDLTTRADRLLESAGAPLVASHGDFHPKNVFLGESGSVTVIDFDTFGAQEREADVAYFQTQLAIMGRFRRGTFAATAAGRRAFLSAYERQTPPLSPARLALYTALTLIQSLHYELCVLHTNNNDLIAPWLSHAERCVAHGSVQLE